MSATPATQNDGGCEIVLRLPRETKVDVRLCNACHVKRKWMSPSATPATHRAAVSRETRARLSQTQARHPVPWVPRLPYKTMVDVRLCHACHVKRRWMSPSATPATQRAPSAMSATHANCMWEMVCDKLVCERWYVTWYVTKLCVDKLCESKLKYCMWKMVCDKVVCVQSCVLSLCVWRDGMWQSCVCLSVCPKLCVKFVCVKRWYVTKLCVYECMLSLCVWRVVYLRWYVTSFVLSLCVCLDHLHRCKTSFCLFCAFVVVPTWFSCHICRGMECASDVSIQRRRICCTVRWIGDAQSTYLLNLFQKWEEAQPKNLHVVYLTCQFFSALLSQSGITFDQICMVLLHQNLPQSKDVESIPRTEFHDGSTIFSCQTLLDC